MSTAPTADHPPLRILLWSPKGAGLHYGGPGMSAYRLYSKAAPGRFQITLAHGNPNQGSYDLFHRHVMIAPLRGGTIDQMRFITAGRHWIARHAHEYDVFHGLQGFDLTVLPAVAAQRRGLPAFVKIAAHQSDLADKPGWKRLLARPRRRRKIIQEVSGIIAISEAIREELQGCGIPDHKIAMIPNGVDTDQFHPSEGPATKQRLRACLGWRDLPTLLFVGGINRRKRPHLLVDTLARLHRQGREYQLVLAGPTDDPPYLEEIRAAAREGGVAERVIEAGFMPDIAPLYRASDVFALPSSNEGMPNALLEAMASALPCLVTPISGSVDLVKDGVTGRWISADASDIASAVIAYLDQPTLASSHGQTALACVRTHYSAAAVLAAHEKMFRKAIGRPLARS